MWYNKGHENTPLYPTLQRRRTQPGPVRPALERRFCLASLPNLAGIRARRTSWSHRQAGGLPQTDSAHGHPWLQYRWAGYSRRRFLASPSSTHDVFPRGVRATAGPAPPQPARLWQSDERVDAGAGSPGQLRTRPDAKAGLRRERTPRPQTLRHELEARQTLDHQPRPTIPAKKTHATA